MLVTMTLLPLVSTGWMAVEVRRAWRQKEAVAEMGGTATYDYMLNAQGKPMSDANPPGPSWLRRLLGNDLFANVVSLDLRWSDVTDATVEHLDALTQLQSLDLSGCEDHRRGATASRDTGATQTLDLSGTRISDAGLQHLDTLGQLQSLDLSRTRSPTRGYGTSGAMGQLQSLDLSGTKITDAGLACLAGLKNLRNLCLGNTLITDAGLEHLAGLSQLRSLDVGGTRLHGGDGLRHLIALPHLEELRLSSLLLRGGYRASQGDERTSEVEPS